MSIWLRYAALLALILAVPSAATAQSNAERAAKLNEEGKTLWLKKNDLAGAVEKFRRAIELSPEARYFFNLCYSLHQLGRFQEALPACRSAQGSDADEALRKKAQLVIDDIEKRGITEPPPDTSGGDGTQTEPGGDGTQTEPGGDGTQTEPGGDGTSGTSTTGDAGATGTQYQSGTSYPPGTGQSPGPIPGLYQPAEIPDDYKWSVGGSLGLFSTNMSNGAFGSSGGTLKLFANFMWLPHQRVGAQGYLNVTQISEGEFAEVLQLVDAGVGLYKHVQVKNFYVTPMVGVQATSFQSNLFVSDTLATLGLRAEVEGAMILGADRRHVISVTPALAFYAPVSDAELDAQTYGLDRGARSFSLTIGYSLRFTTPFGQTSLITLE